MNRLPDLKTYLEHQDPSVIVWRKGTIDDPFIPRSDSLPVINNIITLLEVPSYADKVHITGFVEVPEEIYKKTESLQANEFIVNYAVGIIQFHPSQEGNTLVCSYHGRGVILWPASRVYAIARNNPDILVTLQDYVDQLVDYTKTIDQKIIQINKAISDAVNATNEANMATDNAIDATNDAILAAQTAYDAAATTVVIRKPSVDTYDDLALVYPDPENGWQVLLNSSGDIYRYDGVVSHQWQLIGNIVGDTIPYVSETSDGLLHMEDYQKFVVRSVPFIMKIIQTTGDQELTIQMPFDGVIDNVKAFCSVPASASPLEVSIEKISEADFVNGIWDNIFSQNITIPAGSKLGIGGIVAEDNKTVTAGDYYRINVLQVDTSIRGVTIQMNINTKYIN